MKQSDFLRGLRRKQKNGDNIEQTLHESVRAMNMLKILEIIRKREFYFLLPIVIRWDTVDDISSKAIEKMTVENLCTQIEFLSFDSVIAKIADSIKADL